MGWKTLPGDGRQGVKVLAGDLIGLLLVGDVLAEQRHQSGNAAAGHPRRGR